MDSHAASNPTNTRINYTKSLMTQHSQAVPCHLICAATRTRSPAVSHERLRSLTPPAAATGALAWRTSPPRWSTASPSSPLVPCTTPTTSAASASAPAPPTARASRAPRGSARRCGATWTTAASRAWSRRPREPTAGSTRWGETRARRRAKGWAAFDGEEIDARAEVSGHVVVDRHSSLSSRVAQRL